MRDTKGTGNRSDRYRSRTGNEQAKRRHRVRVGTRRTHGAWLSSRANACSRQSHGVVGTTKGTENGTVPGKGGAAQASENTQAPRAASESVGRIRSSLSRAVRDRKGTSLCSRFRKQHAKGRCPRTRLHVRPTSWLLVMRPRIPSPTVTHARARYRAPPSHSSYRKRERKVPFSYQDHGLTTTASPMILTGIPKKR